MSEVKANVLYDFNPVDLTGLKINEGELLIITDKEVGEGWWKAKNKDGLEGLIPADYVEICSTTPLRCRPLSSNEYAVMTSPDNDGNDDNDSDWDHSDKDESPTYMEPSDIPLNTSNNSSKYSETSKFGNIKMPRSFLKTGGEDFILGLKKTHGEVEATIEIIITDDQELCRWKASTTQSCEIVSHEKAFKFNGIKQFIVYNLKSSYNSQIISRRYKQFDWLYKILSEKFPCIVIPPLPNKQVIGRFEDTFLEFRQRRLQRWLTHITKHPILSSCSAVKHFLTVNDRNDHTEKAKWTKGKRKAENDLFRGAKFFLVISSPCNEINWDEYSKRMDRVSSFIEDFEKSSKALQESFIIFNNRQSEKISKEFIKIGCAINNVSKSITLSPNNNGNDIGLIHGLQRSGEAYGKIGKLFFDQPKIDNKLLDDSLEEINGCTNELPTLIDLAQCAVSTVQYGHRRTSTTNLNTEVADTVDQNVRTITRSIDAELHWLHRERELQLRATMKQYLMNQIKMYNDITTILTDALSIL